MPWLIRYTTPTVERMTRPSDLLDRHGALVSTLWDLGTSGVAEVGSALVAGFDRIETARTAGSLADRHGLVATIEPVDDGWVRHEQVDVEVLVAGETTSFPIAAGAAFGHGGHPTTRLCLDLMGRVFGPPDQGDGAPGADPATSGRRVLDLGTGSGVLAIAAHHLGATTIVACDVDPAAVDAARRNAAANRLDIELIPGGVDEVAARVDRAAVDFDLIVANVLPVVHEQVATTACDLLAPDGVLVLAGFLADQADRVLGAYRTGRPDLDVVEHGLLEEWCGMTLAARPRTG